MDKAEANVGLLEKTGMTGRVFNFMLGTKIRTVQALPLYGSKVSRKKPFQNTG